VGPNLLTPARKPKIFQCRESIGGVRGCAGLAATGAMAVMHAREFSGHFVGNIAAQAASMNQGFFSNMCWQCKVLNQGRANVSTSTSMGFA
tara:strand:+ start:81 stop:353 length:273 start_codon:yes stop_codon:yes gene_type:complete